MLNQVSLFTENNEGGLFKITTILAKANINIYTMLANDSAEFGIVRLIVDKAETAIEVLKAEATNAVRTRLLPWRWTILRVIWTEFFPLSTVPTSTFPICIFPLTVITLSR